VLSCPAGQNTCASGCSDPNFDDSNCGACGTACTAGQVCQLGTCQACLTVTGVDITACGGQCVDLDNDVNNCGTCGKACTTNSCQAGVCAAAPVEATGQDAPIGITVDTVNVYWTNAGTSAHGFTDGTVMKMPLAGGTPVALATGLNLPVGIVSDGTNVYFAELGTAANNYADGVIASVPIATGGTPTVLASALPAPQYVALDAGVVYFTTTGLTDSSGTLESVPVTGGVAATTLASGLADPQGLALDGVGNVYVANYGTSTNAYADGSIAMIPTTGGSVTTIASNQGGPLGIAVGETSASTFLVIWTNNVSGTIAGAANAANQTPTILAENQASPTGIAISNSGLVWTDSGSGTVMTTAYFGANPAVVATGQNFPDAIASDANNNIWWTDQGTAANDYDDGSVMKSAP
jgi:hypothetical protein